jgi:hypothetical protein
MLRSRREALGALVSTAAAMLLVPRSARAVLPKAGLPKVLSRAEAADLGLDVGRRFGTCVITGVRAPDIGALPISLVDGSGRPFTVDLLRHDPDAPTVARGIARAGSLEAYLSNDGDGVLATEEEHGLAAMAIARHFDAWVAAREIDKTGGATLPALLTLRERAERRKKTRPGV